MKQKGKVIWVHILVIMLAVIFLVGIGIGSYFLIQKVFDTESSLMEVDDEKQVLAADISIDRHGVNLIYEIDNDEIIQVLIEVLNSDTGNMDYITVPCNTRLDLSADIEKKLEKFDVDVKEQSIRLDELTKLYGSNAFQFGQLIIGDVFDIDISYYTVMPKKTFVKYFVTDNRSFYLSKKRYDYEMQVLSDTFKTKLKQFDMQLDTLITDSYKDLVSSLNESNKKKYIAAFEEVNVDKIYNWHIIGEEVYGAYDIDETLNNKLLKFIMSNDTKYKYTQDEYNSIIQKKLKE